MKIRLCDGLFMSSDNILRNILVNKEGDLLSIDEGDLFGKRKSIFNKNDWCKKHCDWDMIEGIIDEWYKDSDNIMIGIMKAMIETDYMLDDIFHRYHNYKKIVMDEWVNE